MRHPCKTYHINSTLHHFHTFRIAQQLSRDQKAATQPDCKNAFKHYKDACQRLLRFHVFQDGEPNYAEMLKGNLLCSFNRINHS